MITQDGPRDGSIRSLGGGIHTKCCNPMRARLVALDVDLRLVEDVLADSTTGG